MEGNGGHPLSVPQAEETPVEAPPPYESFIEVRDEEEDKVSETKTLSLVFWYFASISRLNCPKTRTDDPFFLNP